MREERMLMLYKNLKINEEKGVHTICRKMLKEGKAGMGL
jgi:hypothetical protein